MASITEYAKLVLLDEENLIENAVSIACPICFDAVKPYEGVILRECLHSFCKPCLISTIQYSQDAEIHCPFNNSEYSCASIIQECEIKSLLDEKRFEAHLDRSIKQAESAIENTFHCKTLNCRGWCVVEDDIDQFECPVCKMINCLICKDIHEGLNCVQYQDSLKKYSTDPQSNLTKAELESMLDRGEALNCPKCQVLIMRELGCDAVICSMCKTDICWITRGFRWGPAGRGDVSAGCRCGVDRKKCHINCSNCH